MKARGLKVFKLCEIVITENMIVGLIRSKAFLFLKYSNGTFRNRGKILLFSICQLYQSRAGTYIRIRQFPRMLTLNEAGKR